MKFALMFIFSICSFSSTVLCDVSFEDMKKALPEKPGHPYLFFSAEEKPVIFERIKNDPESAIIIKKLGAEANRLLSVTPDAGDLRGNWNAAELLGFIYQMTGDIKFARKGFDFADSVLSVEWVGENYWTGFYALYPRVWPRFVPDDQVSFGFDHISGECASSLAIAYDWLYPGLTKLQRDRFRGGIINKVITKVRGNYEFHWWASAYRCNWCGVCNSGVGLCALTLIGEYPQFADVAAETYNRISRMLDEVDRDGGWQEGCDYWEYMVRTTITFADPLKRMTGGTYNLFKHPRLAENTVNFILYNSIGRNRMIDFEDTGNYAIGRTYMYNKLAAETGNPETAWLRKNWRGEGQSLFDILWPRNDVKPSLPEKKSIHFRDIEWGVLRSSLPENDHLVIGFKAGFNDDPHHGHLDCGHFVVYLKDEAFINDLGHPQYYRKYFEKERWENAFASSEGHNVVLVNGENQIPAKLKDEPFREGTGGRIIEFKIGENRDYALMDPTKAYPGKELKKWRRHIILEKNADMAILVDEVTSSPGAEVETRFHTELRQENRGHYMFLDGKNSDMALIPVTNQHFTIREGIHTVVPLSPEPKVERVPYFGTVLSSKKERTIIATLIIPEDNEKQTMSVIKSVKSNLSGGKYTLSFKKLGKNYIYKFRETREGLIYE